MTQTPGLQPPRSQPPTPSPTLGVILPAAGTGVRLGADRPKQFLPLGGKPLLVHSLEKFLAMHEVARIVLALPEQGFESYRTEIQNWCGSARLVVVPGGSSRQATVALALQQIPEEVGWIAIHDAVRPFFTSDLVRNVWTAARQNGAGAVPGIEVADTVKEVNSQGQVERTIERTRLRRIQTPQIFAQRVLRQCLAQAKGQNWIGTDEAMLLERYDYPVQVVPGMEENIKITSKQDYLWAQRWIQAAFA